MKKAIQRIWNNTYYRVWNKFSKLRGRKKWANIDDICIHYEEYGSGEPLLLLHGGIVDHECWTSQIPTLAKHFRVIAPDTRGHGRSSDNLEKPLSYYQFADDWVKLLDKLAIEHAHVVGWSDGGCSGLCMGLHNPKRIKRMITIGTPYNIANYHDGALDELLGEEQWKSNPLFISYGKKANKISPQKGGWIHFLERLIEGAWQQEPNFTLEQTATIETPTLTIIGENEQLFDLKHAKDMSIAMPNGQLLVIPKATHFIPFEQPKALNRAIINFLKEKA